MFGAFKKGGQIKFGVQFEGFTGAGDEFMWQDLESEQCGFDADFPKTKEETDQGTIALLLLTLNIASTEFNTKYNKSNLAHVF